MQPFKFLHAAPASQDIIHMSDGGQGAVVTTIFISNLHCSTCAHTINETLSSLSPRPQSIESSIVSHAVTVRHSVHLQCAAMKQALEEAGFDIATELIPGPSSISKRKHLTKKSKLHIQQCSMCQSELSSRFHLGLEEISQGSSAGPVSATEKPTVDGMSRPSEVGYFVTLSIGGMTCASCSGAITRALEEVPGVRNVSINLLSNSGTVEIDEEKLVAEVLAVVADIGYDASLVSVRRPRSEALQISGPYRLSLSIGGMTCASCSSTIVELLEQLSGISNVAINLLASSGSVQIDHPGQAQEVLKIINEAGYEASTISIAPIEEALESIGSPKSRTVSLLVDGMFCRQCPQKIMANLGVLGSKVKVDKPLTERDPVVQITYYPQASPGLTIRDIIATVATSKSPPFHVAIYNPPTLEDRARAMQSREQRQILYRLAFSVIMAIPTFIIGVVYMSLVPNSNRTRMYLMEPMWSGNASRIQWAMFLLATPVMFYSAGLYHARSLKEIRALWRRGSRTPIWKRFVRFGSMNLLVSSGVSVAYLSSILLLALAATRQAPLDDKADTTTYFDSVVFLTMFLLMGRYMESYSKSRTADAVRDLRKLRPSEAYLVVPKNMPREQLASSTSDEDVEKGDVSTEEYSHHVDMSSQVRKIPVELLEIGDIVRVQNGSTPPSDGTVLSGATTFNESSLTGESHAIKKVVGDQVFLGTINTAHAVDVRVDRLGGETMLDRIVDIVRDGQSKRAPIERLADKLTGYFVPAVTLLAICTWIIWLTLGYSGVLPASYLDQPEGGWAIWSLKFAIAVFVVACPCGIGLAAPTALLVGSGLAAKFGILARSGGEGFQDAARLDIIVFDKTGTLTQGVEPSVTDHQIFQDANWDEKCIFSLAGESESSSTHPIANAIHMFCQKRGSAHVRPSSFEERPGFGLRVSFASPQCTAIIGNEKLMDEHGVHVSPDTRTALESWKSSGKSVALFALRRDSEATTTTETGFSLVAIFAISDRIRPNAKDVVASLQSRGLQTWIISGDNPITTLAVAKQIGIPEHQVIAGVLPHEKAEKVRVLQTMNREQYSNPLRGFRSNEPKRSVVAMVGDGINDAPALASADVGIAMGSGSDVALSSASFVLMSSELRSLLTFIDLSRTVFRRVKFNFFWALLYNVIALPVAAGVIYPAGHARLDPVWGSLAMALSSISVVCSSIALRLYRPPRLSSNSEARLEPGALPA